MSWKVLVTAFPIAETGQRALALLGAAGCEITLPPAFGPYAAADIQQLLPGHDAVIASLDQYSAAVLAADEAARLKIISRWGVGYDAVDISAASQNGIVVANTAGMLDEAVADYTFALLLSLARGIHKAHVTMRAGEWKVNWGSDVAGQTLGLIGCGRIGAAVARRASGFNLRLLAFDPSPSANALALGVQFVSLDQLLAECDFISLHAALTTENRGLLGETQLRKMKPTALLINAARGALVDETALARALRENWIAGAAVDVFCEEPLPADHPLRATPNLLLTPHQASYARDTAARVSLAAAQAILDLMRGRRPQFVVNPEVFQSANLRAPVQDSTTKRTPT